MELRTRRVLLFGIHLAVGAVAAWMAWVNLRDAFLTSAYRTSGVKGTLWLVIALAMIVPEAWDRLQSRHSHDGDR